MEELERLKLLFDANEYKYIPGNYKSLKHHFRKLTINNKLTARTKEHHYRTLIRFGEWCKVPFSELTEDDILDYCEYLSDFKRTVKGKPVKYDESTLYYYKSFLKRFLKDVRPDLCKYIEMEKVVKTKAPSDMLTREEIQSLIDCCLNNRDRAFISTAYESGARRSELLSIELRHVQFDSNGVVIFIPKSKTFERRVRLVFATSYLREWVTVHPRKNEPNAPLFCSLRSPYNVISKMGLVDQLKDLQKRSGLQKHLTAHLFRHTRATHLAEHLTEQQMKQVLGWTPNSSMASVYVHLSGKDVDNAILKMNGIEVEGNQVESLKVCRCPRCHEIQPDSTKFCGKCGMVMNAELAAQEADKLQKQIEEIQKMKDEIDAMYHAISDPQQKFEFGMKVVKKIHPNRLILPPDDGKDEFIPDDED